MPTPPKLNVPAHYFNGNPNGSLTSQGSSLSPNSEVTTCARMFCKCSSSDSSNVSYTGNPADNTHNRSSLQSSTMSKEAKSRQVLQMVLKDREVRRLLAENLEEQRKYQKHIQERQERLRQTHDWVQATQHAVFPTLSMDEDNLNAKDLTVSEPDSPVSLRGSPSIVTELAQRCLEETQNWPSQPTLGSVVKRSQNGEYCVSFFAFKAILPHISLF